MKTPAQNQAHAAWKRNWRKTHPRSAEANRRNRARAIICEYVKAGTITRLPCHVCGEAKVEAHHPDYSKQREVVWLCRPHHLAVTHGRMSLYLSPQAIAKMRVAACVPMFNVDRIARGIFAKVEALTCETS